MNELDRRQLGSKLALFHQQEEGPGMVSGIRAAGNFIASSKTIFDHECAAPALGKLELRNFSPDRCGSKAAIGRNSAKTCIH